MTPKALSQFLLALLLALCPMVRMNAAPLSVSVPTPIAPVEENEQEEKTPSQTESENEEEATPSHGERRAPPRTIRVPATFSLTHAISTRPDHALLRSTAADPFRNGLGCPFRC